MSVLEEIDATASLLPPDLQVEVLDFIQFLAHKKAKEPSEVADTFPRLPNKRGAAKEMYPQLPNEFGAGKGLITYIADDFDAPLDDLKDYMY